MAGILLQGCQDGCPSCRATIIAGPNLLAAQMPALEGTAEQFLGNGFSAMEAAGRSGMARQAAEGAEQSDLLSLEDTTYDLVEDRLVGLSLSHRLEQGGGLAIETRLSGTIGESRYDLPEGLGIFVDPTEIRFQGASLIPEIAAIRTRAFPTFDLETRLGVGMQLTRSRTSVQSDLLDVVHFETAALGCVVLGVALSDRASGTGFTLDARYSGDAAFQIRGDYRIPLR